MPTELHVLLVAVVRLPLFKMVVSIASASSVNASPLLGVLDSGASFHSCGI